MGEMTDAYKILFQKLKGKRPSGIPVINIVDWIQLAQNRPVAGFYEHGNEHPSSMKHGNLLAI
jgi:hypothetical protein